MNISIKIRKFIVFLFILMKYLINDNGLDERFFVIDKLYLLIEGIVHCTICLIYILLHQTPTWQQILHLWPVFELFCWLEIIDDNFLLCATIVYDGFNCLHIEICHDFICQMDIPSTGKNYIKTLIAQLHFSFIWFLY